jgi:putative mRNA 3-end processing factor
MKISAQSGGIKLEVDDKTVALDSSIPADVNFVSHAHSDHVPRGKKKILCSYETSQLIKRRYNMDIEIQDEHGMELIPSGHILGSTSLLMDSKEGRILYTGDFCNRDRFFLKGFKPPKADVLILETTFGSPRYSFPEIKEVQKESVLWIKSQLESGNNVVAKGYSLGKAQILCSMLEKLENPIFIHGSVLKMNSVYSEMGIDLRGFIPYTEAKKNGYLENGPWIMISPVKMNLDSKTAFFSGWAVDGVHPSFDNAFPLSDHADFNELMGTVKKVDPSVVFTTHGFSREFADHLRSEGYKAIPLESHQMRVDDFL